MSTSLNENENCIRYFSTRENQRYKHNRWTFLKHSRLQKELALPQLSKENTSYGDLKSREILLLLSRVRPIAFLLRAASSRLRLVRATERLFPEDYPHCHHSLSRKIHTSSVITQSEDPCQRYHQRSSMARCGTRQRNLRLAVRPRFWVNARVELSPMQQGPSGLVIRR